MNSILIRHLGLQESPEQKTFIKHLMQGTPLDFKGEEIQESNHHKGHVYRTGIDHQEPSFLFRVKFFFQEVANQFRLQPTPQHKFSKDDPVAVYYDVVKQVFRLCAYQEIQEQCFQGEMTKEQDQTIRTIHFLFQKLFTNLDIELKKKIEGPPKLEREKQKEKRLESARTTSEKKKLLQQLRKEDKELAKQKDRFDAEQAKMEKYQTGMHYRIGTEQKTDEVNSRLKEKLEEKALEWKKKVGDRFATPELKNKLNKREKRQLEKASRYDDFLEVIFSHPSQENWFFQYALQYDLPIEFVVCYPALIDFLRDHSMLDSLAAGGKDVFRIRDENGRRKFQIKVEGHIGLEDPWQDFSLDGEVAFSSGKTISWKKVLTHYKTVPEGERHYDITPAAGLVQYRMLKNARVGRNGEVYGLDLSKTEFWKDPNFVPYQYLSKEEMVSFLGSGFKEHVENEKTVFCWTASGKTPLREEVSDYHGWAPVFKYIPEQKKYLWIPCGSFADDFPGNIISLFLFLGDVRRGIFTILDWNTHAIHRTHLFVPFALEKEAEELFFKIYHNFMVDSNQGNFNFSFTGKNCIYRSEEIFDTMKEELGKKELDWRTQLNLPSTFPDAFSTRFPLTHANPKAPLLRTIIYTLHILPEPVKGQFLKFVELFFFLMWRGQLNGFTYKLWKIRWDDLKFVTVLDKDSTYRKHREIYLPQKLVQLYFKHGFGAMHYGLSKFPKKRSGGWVKKNLAKN